MQALFLVNKIMGESEEFYNKRLPELLRDYVFGIEVAWKLRSSSSSEFIPKDLRRLEMPGCGLGCKSFEFSDFGTCSEAFDLNPISINNAV